MLGIKGRIFLNADYSFFNMNSSLLFSIALFCACAVGGCQGEQYIDWASASTAAATATTQRSAYPTYSGRNGFSGSRSYRRHLWYSRYRFRDSTQVVPTKPEGTEAYVYSHHNSSTEVDDRNSTLDYNFWGPENSTRDNDRWRELFNSTFYGPAYGSHDWRLSMATSTPSPSSTTDGSQLHSKPLSDRVMVEMPGSLAADQDLHFALSLVPMLRQRSLREKLATQVDILDYFRSKLRFDGN